MEVIWQEPATGLEPLGPDVAAFGLGRAFTFRKVFVAEVEEVSVLKVVAGFDPVRGKPLLSQDNHWLCLQIKF